MSELHTIYALSSGQGRAGIAVLRISGPAAFSSAKRLGLRDQSARKAALATLRDPDTDQHLDQALAVHFPAPASFTGEDVVELHLHGGRAVVAAVQNALAQMPNLRPAQAGEFTERALHNGKLDLTQVESLSDLIDSETEQQRLQALRGLEGALGRAVSEWRSQILRVRALLAASIDFADEGDVGELPLSLIDPPLKYLQEELTKAISSFSSARIVNEGFRVAIVGRPNAGKSTLLNALAATDVAIVTDVPGTTRDILEVKLDLAGFVVVLFDTAGLRETDDPVERIGVDKASFYADRADLVLLLDDMADWALEKSSWQKTIRIRTKCDTELSVTSLESLATSSHTQVGLQELKMLLADEAKSRAWVCDAPLVTRKRQEIAIALALESITQARGSYKLGAELIDHHVSSVIRSLAIVIGEIDVEDALGEIFSRFCIGK